MIKSIKSAALLGSICIGFIGILGFLFFIFAIRSPCTHSKPTQLISDLNALASAFELYKINHNDYPPEQDWQSALLPHRPKGRPLTDPWGDPYIYEKDTVDGVTTIKLYSENSDPDDPYQKINYSYEAEE